MLQLKNETPFAATMALFPNEQGIDSLYVVVKATFGLGGGVHVADDQVPPLAADQFWADPVKSSIKYAADLHLTKPSTDVALVGRARAEHGGAVPYLDTTLVIAEKTKSLRVFGNREWRDDGSVTPPEPFESMPLVYEFAFGGVHKVKSEPPEVLSEPRNPLGRGFRGKRKDREMAGRPLPNIEDPAEPFEQAGDKASPQGFGFIAPSWQPRLPYAGTYDQAWQENRAPYLPEDFDPRFFNAAHPDLVFDRYLQGGEPVEVLNASRDGPVRFTLPVCALSLSVEIAGAVETPPLNLETVLIEPDQRRVCLTWRAMQPCDKKALKIGNVEIAIQDLTIDGRKAA